MARIVVIRHAAEPPSLDHHAIGTLTDLWRSDGHDIDIVQGIAKAPEADLAILHVDLSIVPNAYRELASNYRRVVNGAALDIRKRRVSRNLLSRGDHWPGHVVVKTDLNCSGWPEYKAWEHATSRGRTLPPVPEPIDPIVYLRLADVPDAVWANPNLVVERFIAEREDKKFAIRHWIFFGDRGRCKRCLSNEPIVKGSNIIAVEDSEVPEEIQAARKRLGLDFGKMDFVVRNGKAFLFDANKTPGPVPGSAKGGLPEFLAGGLDSLLASPALPA